MATIRMPVEGEDFLQFVKGAPGENPQFSYIPTFAHLLAAAAAAGAGQEPPIGDPEFLEKPLPIAIDIFRNQKLYDILLILVLAKTGDPAVAADQNRVAQVVEELACAGFRSMQEIYAESTPHFWLDSWENHLVDSVESAESTESR